MPEPENHFIASIGGRFSVRCLLAVLITFAGIQYSLQHGRLIRRPMADDANYFVDGLQRVNVLYQNGISGVIHSWIHDAPHSPFSSLLAMASFAIFGRHDWAPYAGNAVVVFALLTAVDWLAGNVRPWQRGMLYAFVLSTRWPWTAVTEFRPDLAAGLAVAVAIILCLRSAYLGSSLGHRMAVGAFFALAIVIKPSMALVNLVLFAVCVIVAIAIDIFARSRRLQARDITPTLISALLIALPYYAFGWRATWDYIYSNIFGTRKEIWQQATNDTLIHKLTYYLVWPDHAGSLVLGIGHVYLLLIVALVGLALIIAGNDRERKYRAAGLVIMGAIAYAIPTFAKTKNFYFGAGFQTLLLLGAVIVLSRVVAMKKCAATGFFVAACVASISMFQSPLYRGDRWTQSVVDSNRLLNEVYWAVQQGQIGDRIFVPAPGGSVSWNTMNYLSLCDDSLRTFANLDYGIWDDQAAIDRELDQADWVVAGDPGNLEARGDLPNGSEGQRLYLQSVRGRPEFVESNTFPVAGGLFYHVFHRKTPAFWGFDEGRSSGLRESDGPYPQWRLPITRAATSEATKLSLSAGGARRILVMSFVCRVNGERLTVLLDGKQVASESFEKSDSFSDFCVPLEGGAGPHQLEIRYSKWDQTGGGDSAVLFRKIQILDGKN